MSATLSDAPALWQAKNGKEIKLTAKK